MKNLKSLILLPALLLLAGINRANAQTTINLTYPSWVMTNASIDLTFGAVNAPNNAHHWQITFNGNNYTTFFNGQSGWYSYHLTAPISPGSYPVQVKLLTSNNTVIATANNNINVTATAQTHILDRFNRTPLLAQVNQPVTIDFKVTNGIGLTQFVWDDDTPDGTVYADSGVVQHVYTQPGDYTVAFFNYGILHHETFRVYDSGNCMIIPVPKGYNIIGQNMGITYNVADTVATMSYNFLGQTGSLPTAWLNNVFIPLPAGTAEGYHDLILTATTNNSTCTDTQAIYCIPTGTTVMEFDQPDTIRTYETAVFNFRIYNGSGFVMANYGDSQVESQQLQGFSGFMQHKYHVPGTYRVKLTCNGVSHTRTLVVTSHETQQTNILSPTLGYVAMAGHTDTITVRTQIANVASINVINSQNQVLLTRNYTNNEFTWEYQQPFYIATIPITWPAEVDTNGIRVVVNMSMSFYDVGGYYGVDTSANLFITERTVRGNVFYDLNSNGQQDTLEAGYAYPSFAIGSGVVTQVRDAQGNYQLTGFEPASNTVTMASVPTYFDLAPVTYTVDMTAPVVYTNKKFALQPNISGNDFEVALFRDAHRFFNTTHAVVRVKNLGPNISTPTVVTYAYVDTMQNILSTDSVPVSTVPGAITFNVPALYPGTTLYYTITAQIAATPGTQFWETAYIPHGDLAMGNDSVGCINTVIGSYDPNDITVSPDTLFTTQMANPRFVDYRIRFQNTGNAPAENVRVVDTLAAGLNMETLEMLLVSHPYTMVVKPNRVVEFLFPNIMLPDSTNNEAGSHGYINFRIKPLAGLPAGTVINSAADIYFDFNPTVRTNTAPLAIIEPLGVKEILNGSFAIFPNPSNGMVYIKPNAVYQNDKVSLRIFAVDGRLVYSESYTAGNTPHAVNTSAFAKGLYSVQLSNGKVSSSQKVVVQ